MSKSHDIPTEAVEAVQSVGEDIQRLGELDDEEFHEFTALMETLGYQDEAEALRSSRRDWLKALGVAGAGLAAGGASGMAVTGTARADPKSTQEGTYGDGNEDWEVQDIDANHVASNSVQTANANTVRNAAEFSDSQTDGIQAAINDLPAGGGAVFVQPGGGSGANGEYLLTTSGDDNERLISLSDVELFGAGSGSIIKLADNQDVYKSMVEPTGNVVIRDLVIDGNRANQTDGGLSSYQNGIFTGPNVGGGTGGDHLRVERCVVRNVQYGGIRLRQSDDVVVRDNWIDGCGERAIQANADQKGDSKGVHIAENYVTPGAPGSDAVGHGIVLGNNIVGGSIIGNHIEGGHAAGIRTEVSEGLRIADNYVEDPGTVGLQLTTSAYCTVTGNVFRNPPTHGIYISGGNYNSISGNLVRDAGTHSLLQEAGARFSYTTNYLFGAGEEAVRIEGPKRGAMFVGNWIDSASQNTDGGFDSVSIGPDSAGDDTKNLLIASNVIRSGKGTSARRAIEADDGNQTGLIANNVFFNHDFGDPINANGFDLNANRGFANRSARRIADQVDLTTAGTQTFTDVDHGLLSQTPSADAIEVDIRSADADDWVAQVTDVTNVGGNDFDCTVYVSDASGVGGALGDFVVRANSQV